MAISYIGGGNNGSSTAVTTISVTYSPVVGNTLCVFLALGSSSAGLSIVDNLANSLTTGPTLSALYGVYYTVPSGVTTLTASWTTAKQCGMVLMEYSGVSSVNASLTGNTATATSTTPSISVTTQDANDFVVAGFHTGTAMTTTSGNQRKSESVGFYMYGLDNTSATAGSVTLGGTMTSSAWVAVAIELRASASGSNHQNLLLLGCG
jgi:hypothetical protein